MVARISLFHIVLLSRPQILSSPLSIFPTAYLLGGLFLSPPFLRVLLDSPAQLLPTPQAPYSFQKHAVISERRYFSGDSLEPVIFWCPLQMMLQWNCFEPVLNLSLRQQQVNWRPSSSSSHGVLS